MNTQQLLRHWNSKRSLNSRDKVIRLMWPVLHEQAQLFYESSAHENDDSDAQGTRLSLQKLVQEFLDTYLQPETPSEVVEELIAPFDSNFSPYEWRLIAIRRFFTEQILSKT